MIYSNFETENARILIWEINETEEQLIPLLTNFAEYKPEFDAIKTTKRKLEFLVARIMLNLASNTEICIRYDKNNKPFCSNNTLQLSISHCSKWVTIIIHRSQAVGIDIEIISPRFEKVYKRFLSEKEQSYLYNQDDLVKTQLAWSAKESLYKIIGNEAVDFSKQLEITDFEIASAGKFSGLHTPTQSKYELNYMQLPPFNLVYCISPYTINSITT